MKAALALGALLLALLGAPMEAAAQGRPSPAPTSTVHQRPVAAGKVSVQLLVVHATNSHKRVDGQLRPLLPHLRFISYTGFSVLETHEASLAPTQSQTFSIAGGRRVEVKLLSRSETEAKLQVSMHRADRKLLDTTVRIHRNRSFIVAGPKHEGGVLILPVTARY